MESMTLVVVGKAEGGSGQCPEEAAWRGESDRSGALQLSEGPRGQPRPEAGSDPPHSLQQEQMPPTPHFQTSGFPIVRR